MTKFDLPDPSRFTLAECAEWVGRFMWAFNSDDERGEFARQLYLRLRAIDRESDALTHTLWLTPGGKYKVLPYEDDVRARAAKYEPIMSFHRTTIASRCGDFL